MVRKYVDVICLNDKGGNVNRNVEVIDKLKAIRSELQAIGKDLGGLV